MLHLPVFLVQRKLSTVFVESFFVIPGKSIESKLHFQFPWLFGLELDRAKMVDRKLTMAYVAGRIVETFQTDLLVFGVRAVDYPW
jgi:DNA-directed RNA polymerase II subunit RPB1